MPKRTRIRPFWERNPIVSAFSVIVVLLLIILLPIGAVTGWTFNFKKTQSPTSKPTQPPTSISPTSKPNTQPPTSAPIPSTALTDANIRGAVQDYFSNDQNTKNSVIAKYGDMPEWDVSRVTDMSYLFNGKNNIPDITKWNTSSAQTMAYMFKQASYFNQDISNWNVSNVSDMTSMFAYAFTFNQPIQKWNTKSLKYMVDMFAYASGFEQTLCWEHSNINTTGWNTNSGAKWC